MEQPLGFVAQRDSGFVCRVHKALYGLKQALRAWFGKFSDVIQQFDMHRCQYDHLVFSSITRKGRFH